MLRATPFFRKIVLTDSTPFVKCASGARVLGEPQNHFQHEDFRYGIKRVSARSHRGTSFTRVQRLGIPLLLVDRAVFG